MACNTACYSCYGSNSNECYSCTSASGTYFYEEENSCLDNCPVGYYEDTTISGTETYYVCTTCTTGCSSCTDADTC